MKTISKFPESFIEPGLTVLVDRAYLEKKEEAKKSTKEAETTSPE